jgi:3-oxoacyl-[acyl-carrier-protein] synthase II
MNYYINGIGFITPFASGCGKECDYFDPEPGEIKPITRKDFLHKPYKPFGRMDFFSKIGFAGIYYAYKDAGLINTKLKYNEFNNTDITYNTPIIASTHSGCIDTDINFADSFQYENGKNASPSLFAYTLPNTFLGEISIYLKTIGENFIINEDSVTGMTGLKMGFDILDTNESDIIICGICNTGNHNMVKFNPSTIFSGSLFLTLSKLKNQFTYGSITEDINGNIIYKNMIIETLLDLAQVCIKNKTFKFKDTLVS